MMGPHVQAPMRRITNNTNQPAGTDRCTRSIAFVHVNKAGGTAMLENLRMCCNERTVKLRYQSQLQQHGLPRNFFFHGSG